MLSPELQAIGERARRIYDAHVNDLLANGHGGKFIAIEPESGEYFLGDTIDEAREHADRAYPERISHMMRVGHRAAVRIGAMLK